MGHMFGSEELGLVNRRFLIRGEANPPVRNSSQLIEKVCGRQKLGGNKDNKSGGERVPMASLLSIAFMSSSLQCLRGFYQRLHRHTNQNDTAPLKCHWQPRSSSSAGNSSTPQSEQHKTPFLCTPHAEPPVSASYALISLA